MRVLILSALVALAAAAPADVEAPIVSTPEHISSEDAEAAAIDARVSSEDQAQLAADQAQIAADQARMFTEEKTIEADSITKEQTEESVWANEEKKWQAIDAVKTAEAQIDGAVASNAAMIARSAYGNVYVPGVVPAPLIYSAPAIFAPTLKVADVKAADPVKGEEPVKAAEPAKEAEKPIFPQPLLGAPLAYPNLKLASPWVSPVAPLAGPLTYYQPGLPTHYYQAPLVAPYLKQW